MDPAGGLSTPVGWEAGRLVGAVGGVAGAPDALHGDQAREGALEEPGSHVWKTLKGKGPRELF